MRKHGLYCLLVAICLLLPTSKVNAQMVIGGIVNNYKEDVDRNGTFDILDLAKVGSKYNLLSTSINFEKSLDINNDNIIDIYDLITVSKRIGNDTAMKDFSLRNESRLDSYKETFKIAPTYISNVTATGGAFGSNVYENAFDGNLSTFYETSKANSKDFKNEVTFTFEDLIEINKITYASRKTQNYKGFMKEFEVYGSLDESSDDFTLIFSGKGNVTGTMQEINFQTTKFKRLKLKFIDGNGNWSSIAEIEFYKEDKVIELGGNIFKDKTYSELQSGFDTIEEINEFEKNVLNHPFKAEYQTSIVIAKDIINNPEKYKNAPIITSSQKGDERVEAQKRQIAKAFYTLDSFGYYVAPGETFTLYVDADPKGTMPSLLLEQAGADRGGLPRFYMLKPGINTIKAPTFDTMYPAAIYIVNGALPKDQAYAPRIRLDGGEKYPVYIHGKTTPEEFKSELEAYGKNVSTDINDYKNGKPTNGKVYNIAELISENNTITTSALGALKAIQEMEISGLTVKDTMDSYEKVYNLYQSYTGFVEGDPDEKHTPYPGKFTYRVYSSGPYAWAATGYTGYNGGDVTRREGSFYKSLVKPFGDSWGAYHELGHMINDSKIEHVEVTNNLYAQRFSEGNRVNYDELYAAVSGKSVPLGFWTNLGLISQVEFYYGKDTIAKTNRVSRDNPNRLFDGVGTAQERLALAMSVAVGYDLLDHFGYYKYITVTDELRAKVAHLPKPTVKLNYVNYTVFDYNGKGFNKNVKVGIDGAKYLVTKKAVLNFTIDDENKENLLGFEVYRDGVLIGFTDKMTYTDKDVSGGLETKYSIKAVDKKLNIAEEVILKLK